MLECTPHLSHKIVEGGVRTLSASSQNVWAPPVGSLEFFLEARFALLPLPTRAQDRGRVPRIGTYIRAVTWVGQPPYNYDERSESIIVRWAAPPRWRLYLLPMNSWGDRPGRRRCSPRNPSPPPNPPPSPAGVGGDWQGWGLAEMARPTQATAKDGNGAAPSHETAACCWLTRNAAHMRITHMCTLSATSLHILALFLLFLLII